MIYYGLISMVLTESAISWDLVSFVFVAIYLRQVSLVGFHTTFIDISVIRLAFVIFDCPYLFLAVLGLSLLSYVRTPFLFNLLLDL